jgi:hypothetical protein
MPSPTRNNKEVWLLTSRVGEEERPVCVCGTFKAVYAHALFQMQIAEASLGERAAREEWKKAGLVWIWDRSRFESYEEAMWSPLGSLALIEKIPVKKV